MKKDKELPTILHMISTVIVVIFVLPFLVAFLICFWIISPIAVPIMVYYDKKKSIKHEYIERMDQIDKL